MKRVLLFCIFLFCLTACKTLPDTIPVTSVTISQPTAEMIEGETVQLRAIVQPDNATDKAVQWASSKQSVATISENGLVTAIAEGTSTITAIAGGKTGSCQVTVSKRVIAVSSISLNKEELDLVEGDQETLVATVMPENATDKAVEWTTSAPDIATVDGGKITAIKEGAAIITAKAGEHSTTCKVVVSKMVIAVESIELNRTSVELIEGDSDILVANVLPDNATDKTVTWVTSDESIVTVDNSGKIKAIKEGKATIAAKAGEKTATCAVTVSKRVIPVESITLDRTTLVMTEDESTVITATVKPDNATDKTVVWSTSDASIATVFDGRVTAIKEGKAIITAKAGEKAAMCEVTVKKLLIDVTSITLDHATLSLVKGEEKTLVATVKPDNATNKTVTWSSSDGQIAEVDNSGRVTAVKSGTATITAKAGNKTATCVVTVSTPIESISLNETSITLEEGQATKLVAIISPSDADDKDVTWSTSASSVARVDQDGTVTAVKDGTAIITAKAGDKTATCTVTVKKKVIQVSSVTLNKTTLSLEKGKSETLVATVDPDNATDKTVNWSTSNETIVSVDANGKVTALKSGQAVITAKAGEKSANCTVTVTVPVTSVTLSKTSVSLTKGETTTITATVNPSDATDKTVTWTSSDEAVATVSSGKITAVKSGTATIVANAGGQTASCSVSVTTPVTSITLDRTSVSLEEEQYTTLTATVTPNDADDKAITWSSSSTAIATVDNNGKVTAVKEGTATITAQAGDKTATCTVSVQRKIISGNPLTFTSTGETSISLKRIGSPTGITLEYKTNAGDWTEYILGDPIDLSDGDQISFRAGEDGNNSFSQSDSKGYRFIVLGDGTIAGSGNIMSLLNREVSPTIAPSWCFSRLFENCTCLTTAPELPATTLGWSCYCEMFSGCTSLTSAPELPATNLSDYCYSQMFSGCTSLTSAPELPATNLSDYCYNQMFSGCTSLTSAPELPATNLRVACYHRMFEGCERLKSAPLSLPATTLVSRCYIRMFYGCTSLTSAPKLPATTLVDYCYANMFEGCSNLKYIKALFNTTPSNTYTRDWLKDVAASGTFVKSSAATWNVTGPNGVPSRWTILTE